MRSLPLFDSVTAVLLVSLLALSPAQVHRLVGNLLDIACCGVQKLMIQVGQRASHGQLVTDLWHVAIRGIELGEPHSDQSSLIAVV